MSTLNYNSSNAMYKIEDYLEEARQSLRKAEKLADEVNTPFYFRYCGFNSRYTPSTKQVQFTAKMAEDLLRSGKSLDKATRDRIAEVLKGNFVTAQERNPGSWS